MSIGIDVKYAARLLVKKPAFTATTVFIIAIGLGLTLFAYSLLSSLIFKPLTMNTNQQFVTIEGEYDYSHAFRRSVDPFHLNQAVQEVDAIDDITFHGSGTALLSGLDTNVGTKKFNATFAKWNFFDVAGQQPIMGRDFTEADNFDGAEKVIMISYEVWQSYFKGISDIVDKMVNVDSEPMRIIGVMPENFSFPSHAQTWLLMPANQINPTKPSRNGAFGIARLKNSSSIEKLNQELSHYNQKAIAELPEEFNWRMRNNSGIYLQATAYKKANSDVREYYSIFISLLVVVFLILLLACINVGNLLLTRVNERYKEIAIRVALGVPRQRLIFQMLWESIFFCAIGAFIAFVLASWGIELTNAAFTRMFAVQQNQPFWWTLSIDADALLVLFVAILFMILITGLIPAWRALSGDFNSVLRDGTRGAMGKKASQTNQVLVISEILLSCIVLVIATILLTTSYFADKADYGVDTDKRITARLELPLEYYNVRRDTEFEAADNKKRNDFYYQLKSRLEELPTIEAVAYMTQLPGTGEGTSHFEIEGMEAEVYDENPVSNNEVIGRDSWRAVGMHIIQGRDFDDRDAVVGANSMIVNESIARELFPDGQAVGYRVRQISSRGEGDWQNIVGVVSDSYHGSAMDTSSAQYNSYHLMDARSRQAINIAIHYKGSELQAKQTLFDTLNATDANVSAYHIQSYQQLIQHPMMLVTTVSKIFLFCGVMAVLLAASGIYAVSANSITQKTQEIGVRRALGATDSNVMKLFLSQAVIQLAIGLGIGIVLSMWVIKTLQTTMIINDVSYIIGLVGMPLLIIAIVLLATFIPAKKVVEMEPSEALHHD